MQEESWIYISAFVVAISGVYYAIRAWQGKIYPNPVSWGVWAFVGVALFLTADASKASAVYWSMLVSALNPAVIATIILLRVKDRGYNLVTREKWCLFLALVGYFLWYLFHKEPEVAPWSMYWMISVDLFALWPTWRQVRENPFSDKPLPWIIFGCGFGLSGLAITEHTLTNWALPIYMFIGANAVAAPMILKRIQLKSPPSEWL